MPLRLLIIAGLLLLVAAPPASTGSSFPISPPDPVGIWGASRRATVGDGTGGFFVAWEKLVERCSHPSCPDTFQVSVQRIWPNHSTAPGWPAGGSRVSTSPASQTQAVVAPDGSGGVFVAWRDERPPSPRIYCQRLDAAGNRAAGWPEGGLQVSGQFNYDRYPLICPDGAGGAFIVWLDQSASTLYAQRVNGVGEIVAGWPTAGLILCQAPGTNDWPDVCSDLAGGFYVVWEDTRAGVQPDLYGLRISAAGTRAPGWAANGNAISTAVGWQRMPQVCSDGSGGVIVTWMDQRNDPNDIYAQRLLSDGTVAPGWVDGGTPICEAADGQWNPAITSDGAGGAVVAWYDRRGLNHATYATRVTGSGAIASGWPVNGASVSVGPRSSYTTLVPDREHGAIVVWDNSPEIFAQRLTGGGAVAGGWPAGGLLIDDQGFDGGLNPIASVSDSAGGAFIVWTRSGVRGNHVSSQGTLVTVGTPRITPAEAIGVTMLGPNPSRGQLRASLVLPERATATVTLHDVSGRIAWRHEAGVVEPGVTLSLAVPIGHLAAGLYWLQVSQGTWSASKRVSILR